MIFVHLIPNLTTIYRTCIMFMGKGYNHYTMLRWMHVLSFALVIVFGASLITPTFNRFDHHYEVTETSEKSEGEPLEFGEEEADELYTFSWLDSHGSFVGYLNKHTISWIDSSSLIHLPVPHPPPEG